MAVETEVRESARRLRASRVWYGVLFAVVLASLTWQTVLVVQGGTDVNAGESAAHEDLAVRLVRLASYFTIQSNVLVCVGALLLMLRPGRDSPAFRVLHLDALLGIAITGLVFATILAPLVDLEGAALVVNAGLHFVAPVATVLGWILVGPRGRVDRATIARAFVWPVAWIAYTLVHGAFSGWYPYPFLDVAEIGYPMALLNIVLVLVVAFLLALLASWADRKLVRK
ncbi:Pr6Pr family membrane protein [Glycomyces sp. NPDC048151]|uniref:Pr6Pr family membrane protein n=1 Tax=Glycomyces sp. NPDC048151 TaxID=3364002 RepID=UPI00371470D9